MKPTATLALLLYLLTVGIGIVQAKRQQAKAGAKANGPDDAEVPAEEADDTIEYASDAEIDDIVDSDERFVVVFFYDRSAHRCPSCARALHALERIDAELEADGLVEVVKTDDAAAAAQVGVHAFPALVYYRRDNPILYDGDFSSASELRRWLRAHDEVAGVELGDDDFEQRTSASEPDERELDWLVVFYDQSEADCASGAPVWELAAHRLRGLVRVGTVDVSRNDDVAERFGLDDDDDQCPTVLLLRAGRMHRYAGEPSEAGALVAFALHRYKEQRGQKVPPPPTEIEEFVEELKEDLAETMEEQPTLLYATAAGCLLLVAAFLRRVYNTVKEKGE